MAIINSNGKVGRPWVSMLVDDASGKILAYEVNQETPNYRRNVSLLLECVRTHRALPHRVVMDGGKEFSKRYFVQLLASCSVVMMYSPLHKSMASRYQAINTALRNHFCAVASRPGQERTTAGVTDINSKHGTVWTMEQLSVSLRDFCDTCNSQVVPALRCSPNKVFKKGLKQRGLVRHVDAAYFEKLAAPIIHPQTAI